jgi:hypothetical protein
LNNISELRNILNSKHNLIYIVTHEEERVMNDIGRLAEAANYTACSWTITSGLRNIAGNYEIPSAQNNNNGRNGGSSPAPAQAKYLAGSPIKILEEVDACKNNTLFVLNDFHAFFKDAEVIRSIKDTI